MEGPQHTNPTNKPPQIHAAPRKQTAPHPVASQARVSGPQGLKAKPEVPVVGERSGPTTPPAQSEAKGR
ncbi:hypothetical protein, partial [Streptomyces sp. NPDC048338]|uniref:hypothetical protein n=1 Tax=Streptomyces sp. NPDC048338 TaxID=3365536 RepID=UPI00371AD605